MTDLLGAMYDEHVVDRVIHYLNMYVHTYVDIYFRRSRPYFLLVLFLYNVVIIVGTDQEYI